MRPPLSMAVKATFSGEPNFDMPWWLGRNGSDLGVQNDTP